MALASRCVLERCVIAGLPADGDIAGVDPSAGKHQRLGHERALAASAQHVALGAAFPRAHEHHGRRQARQRGPFALSAVFTHALADGYHECRLGGTLARASHHRHGRDRGLRTGELSMAATLPPSDNDAAEPGVHAQLADALPIAACILDRAGLVTWHNRAFAELIQRDDVDGEPFLGWIGRAAEREGFGRAFLGLRERDPGSGFAMDLGLVARLGPPAGCRVRAVKLAGGAVGLSCLRIAGADTSPENELGLAVARGLDALDQGVLLVDADARIVHGNPTAAQLLGNVIGRSVLELADAPARSTLTRAFALARGGSWQGELVLRRGDGESLPVELSLAAGSGPAVVLVRDLRDRRRREFEEQVIGQVDRCLVESVDPRQSVAAACYVLAAAIGASRAVVLAGRGELWERWELQEGVVARAIELGPSVMPAHWAELRAADDVDPTDDRIRATFGPLGDVRAALRVPLRGPSGTVGHLLLGRSNGTWDARDRNLVSGVAAQIGLGLESGLLNLATRELADYQAMVLDQTTVLIDTVDAQGRVVTWNRASEGLLGTPAAAAVGRGFGVEVARAADRVQWEDLWATLMGQGVVAREIVLLGEGGTEVPVHLEGRRLRRGEDVAGAVFVGLDLRDRRALERQILRSQKLAAVGLLAAGIAHEINNPLTGVVGYSKLLLERNLPSDVRERVEKIAQSGERCRKIVEGVLLFSRQQDSGVRRRIELGELLDRVLSIGEYQWRMHNVRIMREIDRELAVLGDADQLEQVVLNLLSNAVDAMPRGGRVHLRLRRADGAAELVVADEGHGIPPEIQARIFDPFFSTKEIGKGTGLGLAISYGIVQDHGGDILVDSPPGEGARFTVVLPALAADAGSDPPGSAPSAAGSRSDPGLDSGSRLAPNPGADPVQTPALVAVTDSGLSSPAGAKRASMPDGHDASNRQGR